MPFKGPVHPPIDLSLAGAGNFVRGRSRAVEALWILAEWLLVTNPLQISSRTRIWALRLFGAKIGAGVIARPRLRVKFPWHLSIGDNCWIGEGVWLHNQGLLTVEHDVVISQEVFVTTGSHDTQATMDLCIDPVVIRAGAWITTRAIVLKGVEIGINTIVTPGSVITKSLEPDSIYGGNPAKRIGDRWRDSRIVEGVRKPETVRS